MLARAIGSHQEQVGVRDLQLILEELPSQEQDPRTVGRPCRILVGLGA